MRPLLSIYFILSLLFATSCEEPFDPVFLIKEARVIAIIATPPEAHPGEEVTLSPVIVSPEGTLSNNDFNVQWWRCPDDERDPLADDSLCGASARIDLGSDTSFSETLPLDFFPKPEDAQTDSSLFESNEVLLGALLGYWRVIGASLSSNSEANGNMSAFKRVVIKPQSPLADLDPSLERLDTLVGPRGDLAKNTNPTLSNVEIREGNLDGNIVSTLRAGETYFFIPRADSQSLQVYFELAFDLEGLDIARPGLLESFGEVELLSRFSKALRCEVPRYSWFVSGGTLVAENTLDEEILERAFANLACPKSDRDLQDGSVRFKAPLEAGPLRIWTVMRDGRGGTDVFERTLEVLP